MPFIKYILIVFYYKIKTTQTANKLGEQQVFDVLWELEVHMCQSQKTKKQNRINIMNNSIGTFKMAHILKNSLEKKAG